MLQLEAHHLLRCSQVCQLLLLGLPTLLDEVFEEQCVLAHALDGLQEVGGQVHLVSQLHLLELPAKESGLSRKGPPELREGSCLGQGSRRSPREEFAPLTRKKAFP